MDNDIGETVYGTNEDSHVMSERVQTLAASIYKEFERMIKNYDENVVKELMPLVVGILESLDQSYVDKQENEVEVELLRDDNEQLLTQYEREKQLRKSSEQKYLEAEDSHEEERKNTQSKVESLESIVRMFELKAKNAQDHISRLDDKEQEMRKEYNKLHERYTELFKTHMDYMERTKMVMGGDRIMEMANTPRGKMGLNLPNLKAVTPVGMYSPADTPVKTGTSPPNINSIMSPARSQDSNTSLKSEMRDLEGNLTKELKDNKNRGIDVGQTTDLVETKERNVGTKPQSSGEMDKKDKTNTEKEEDKKSQSESETKIQTESESKPDTQSENTVQNESKTTKTVIKATAIELSGSFEKLFHQTDLLGDVLAPSLVAETPDLEDIDPSGFEPSRSTPIAGASRGKANESSIFDELALDQDALGEMDDGIDITGKVVTPGEYSSSGMGKEVENLILENTELLATKNALNVVKDDLIAKVDELSRIGKDEDLLDEYVPMVLRSEQEILREEIQSLQAVKTRLKARVSELEEDLKKSKEELEKAKSGKTGENENEEEEVPMAQRKRFTRVEMARVLMERNQYKERLMELQEAVRWTEMIRASREHPELVTAPKKKGSIWNFFSNLFSSSNKPSKRPVSGSSASVRYNAPTTAVRPVGDPNKKQRDNYNLGEKAKAYDFLQDDLLTEKKRKEREKERREQYKQVQVHVKKDDGRMQAYGWSLPAKFNTSHHKENSSKSQVPVPVPVYCRPLLEKDPGMKIWCAAGVNVLGGKTRDGGNVVGASVFYSNPPSSESKENEAQSDIEKLDQELKEHEKGHKEGESEQDQLCSLVWICTTTHNSSRVTVIDANNPADVLDTFHVTSSHILCIASVPGAQEDDYPGDDDSLKADIETEPKPSSPVAPGAPPSGPPGLPSENKEGAGENTASIGNITFVQCATGTTSKGSSANTSPVGTPSASMQDVSHETQADMSSVRAVTAAATKPEDNKETEEKKETQTEEELESSEGDDGKGKITRATGSPSKSQPTSPAQTPTEEGKRLLKAPTELVKDGISAVPTDNDFMYVEVEKMSSVQATMWLGTQSGSLYVHSASAQWKRCLHSVKLKDSVLSIVHIKGRVFVALADGSVAVFHRATDGQWDLTNYHLVDLGKPHHSIRCMCIIANKHLWCGYRNRIHVLHPKTLRVEKTFDAHPRKESQVRQLSWVGDGVWVSIRLDSTLRLYHAYTHQHLQDVDIEPYVSKMLGTGKLGFSFVRITSLLVSCNRLWIGTGNGVIISVPLSENNKHAVTTATAGRPGGVIRVYQDTKTDSVTPGSFIPYCSMAQAQLSFHGHRDAVKFFVAVPGAPQRGMSGTQAATTNKEGSKKGSPQPSKNMLVISGGEGYIDFRIGDTEEEEGAGDVDKKSLSKGDRSHLVVWHLTNVMA